MELVEQIDRKDVEGRSPIAESDQFAVYALGGDTYLIVQRHEGTPWKGIRVSGDGLFRVGSLMVEAMRHLYRDIAQELSPVRRH
jgi:hypothetical protein